MARSSRPPSNPAGRDVGFFGALFDFGFEHFVTTKIIKTIYVLALLFIGLGFLVELGAAANMLEQPFGKKAGALMLVLAPITSALFVVLARVYCEFAIVFFQISGFLKTLAQQGPRSS